MTDLAEPTVAVAHLEAADPVEADLAMVDLAELDLAVAVLEMTDLAVVVPVVDDLMAENMDLEAPAEP